MEFFDVLDKNGNPTGQIKARADVHRDGDWHKAVHIWILNSSGELLIQKRSLDKAEGAGQWDISAAGHVPAGETVVETATKELEEELGLEISKNKIEYLFTVKYTKLRPEYINNEFDDVFLVELDLDISKIQIQKEELTEIKFVDYRELEKMVNRNDENILSHDEEYKKLFELLHTRFDY